MTSAIQGGLKNKTFRISSKVAENVENISNGTLCIVIDFMMCCRRVHDQIQLTSRGDLRGPGMLSL